MSVSRDGTGVSGVYSSGTSYTTSGITCAANSVITLFVLQAIVAAAPAAPSVGGFTFSQIGTTLTFTEAGFNYTLTAWRCKPTTALSGAAITVPMATGGAYGTAFAQAYKGVDQSGTNGSGAIGNVATAHGTGTTASVADTTSRASSEVIACAATYGSTSTATAGSGQGVAVSNVTATLRGALVDQNANTPSSGTAVTDSVGWSVSSGWGVVEVELLALQTSFTASDSVGSFSDTASHPPPQRTASDSFSVSDSTASRGAESNSRTAGYYPATGMVQPGTSAAQPGTRTQPGLGSPAFIGDGFSVSDSASVSHPPAARSAADAVSFSDGAVRGSEANTRSATDAVGAFSDSASRGAGAHIRSAADSFGVSDSARRAGAVAARTASDALSVSDSASRAPRATSRTSSDVVSISDGATRSGSPTRSAADVIGSFSDSVTRTTTHARTAGDSVSIGDTASRGAITSTRHAADSLTFISDIATRAIEHPPRTAGDFISFADDGTATAVVVRSASDFWAVSDSAARTWAGAGRVAFDAFSPLDSATSSTTYQRAADDGFDVSDSVARRDAGSRSASDIVPIFDQVDAPTWATRGAADAFSVADGAVTGGIAFDRTAADSFSVADASIGSPHIFVGDAWGVFDSASTQIGSAPQAFDSWAVSDSARSASVPGISTPTGMRLSFPTTRATFAIATTGARLQASSTHADLESAHG